MNITEKEFIRMKSIQRELCLFKNTEEILKKQKKIDINQKIQYIVMTGIMIVIGWMMTIKLK